ncbi:glycosyltransferase family 1 protein [Gordonia sp. TBRC 11910]|uniref:Glycosyltransferase family 1 protein n=1 Tax=Gordonia asplenii TaxID=2725283 RepID=A0A848KVR3_9ACTN|nr:glycosyltransferase [Gordonia asplenii]NMO02147.1 glycosyltransferase family 1 protein [Gordonia asplenii]
MTAITIAAFGTRGDVAPLVGLGTGLRDRLGAQVAIAAQQPYEQMIVDAGLAYRGLPHDTEIETRSSEFGQGLVDGAKMRPSKEALAEMREQLSGVGEAMASASEDADLVLFEGPVGSLLGPHVAQALGVRAGLVHLQPASATGDFAPPALGTRSFGRIGNRMVWRLGASGEKVFAPLTDALRTSLGLSPRSRKDVQRNRNEWPTLYGFSGIVVPRPADWPSNAHVCGYWRPAPAHFTPPRELVDFLDAGDAPVFVGLGSTATAHGAELSTTIIEALRKSGRRGVVQRGWARLDVGSDADVITVDDVPHDWLFGKVGAAVHHCGAGTTAAALHAGIPSVPVPGIMDQPFWAARVHALGAAASPVPRHSISADALAAAIDSLSDRHTARCTEIAGRLAAEDGVGEAVTSIARMIDGAGVTR